MYISAWDSEKPLYDSTADELKRQFMQYCYDCPKRALSCSAVEAQKCENEKQLILRKLKEHLDSIDSRKYCVVMNKRAVPKIRRVLFVKDDADKHLKSVMNEFYFNENKLEDDEFVFITGYRKMMKFVNQYLE